ncbi:PREDICTED: CAAX prenyl protease 1 homolog [Dufourea novaeangliae]|uniref:CAAX prenyl protease n=1 Tax=Dufourea novaeangliae TaxID=178035 RepID=A0A154P2S4_DUFNO|nr:PREDICTED: CAAX prenyl protease 1 homolog [Dufourea novaeangliae]KZC06235.1 CAAX prenyl protease 1 like protein [Dufourea novaeangliae]
MPNFFQLVEDNILYEILALIWLLFLWKLYLNIRQRALMNRLVELPTSVEGFMTKDVYDKARSYDLDKLNFSTFKNIYSELLATGVLLALCYSHFWQWSIYLGKYFGLTHENEILLSGIYILITNVIHDVVGLPLTIYNTFVIEEKHGFNKETPLFFIKDQLLKFLVAQIIVLPLGFGIIWIIENGGDYFFLYLWVFLVVVTVFMMILYPEVIAPLFDKYIPLPDGDLKTKIEALAASVDFPLYKLFIVEGSKRSSHSNAYLYGFHKHKRIVLFDTLVKEYYKPAEGETEAKGCETDEVLAVLAHELGHWKYNHTLKGFMFGQVSFLANVLLYAKLLNYKPMYLAFGFTDAQPTIIGLTIVTMYILIPITTLMQFFSVVIGRRFEFEADRFAKILGHGEELKRALIKLQKDNLGYPLYDRLYSSWHHSHPPLLERLEAIDKDK